MDDQNSLQKPALTLDEELDVLEAVYPTSYKALRGEIELGGCL